MCICENSLKLIIDYKTTGFRLEKVPNHPWLVRFFQGPCAQVHMTSWLLVIAWFYVFLGLRSQVFLNKDFFSCHFFRYVQNECKFGALSHKHILKIKVLKGSLIGVSACESYRIKLSKPPKSFKTTNKIL